jgi:hypothetical protein
MDDVWLAGGGDGIVAAGSHDRCPSSLTLTHLGYLSREWIRRDTQAGGGETTSPKILFIYGLIGQLSLAEMFPLLSFI